MVERMSISRDLNAKALGAQKALMINQLIWKEISWMKRMVLKLFQCLRKGMKLQRNETRQPSRAEDAMSDNRSRLVTNLNGKRRNKPTKGWLDYQTFQLEERRSKLHSRIIKNLSAVDELLHSSRNVEAVQEQMIQIDDKFKMLMIVHKNIILYCH